MEMSFEDRKASAKHEAADTCTSGIDALLSSTSDREKIGDQSGYIKNTLQTSRLPLVVEEAVDCDVTNASSINWRRRDTLNRPMKGRKILKVCKPLGTSCKVTGGGVVNIPNIEGDIGNTGHKSN